ncbi:MAG: hypothetical protein GX610_19510 [Rhodococcus sp.]|nr:hypothetical protein [Rhodococcus sp. (in: high G+C Gram-positive bacteria)]
MTGALPARIRTSWNNFVGPDATVLDNTVTLTLAALGAAAAPSVTHAAGPLPSGQRVVLRLLATDLWGGAWANNTRACARWYERPGQTDSDHIAFAAMHVHPAVLAWMDRGYPPHRVHPTVWAGAHYGYLMAATYSIRRRPDRRRLLGVGLTVGGVALDLTLGPSRVAPWFAPVYYVKLLLGHASAALSPVSA